MMAEQLKGEGEVNALGKTWTLKLPFSEAKRLKAETGIDVINDGASAADLDKFDIVLHAALRKVQPDVTIEDALAILDEVGIKPVAAALQPALAALAGVSASDLKKAAEAPSQ